jgi:cytochrome oxidase Cu insertion factor (SCO1/SenC/PrrC family)
LHSLISEGFHLAVAERPENTDGEGLITHSDRFVLVDSHLQIRGYYHGTEQDAVQRIVGDVRALQREAVAAQSGNAGAENGMRKPVF